MLMGNDIARVEDNNSKRCEGTQRLQVIDLGLSSFQKCSLPERERPAGLD